MSGQALQFAFLGAPARLAEPRWLWLLALVAALGVLAARGLLRRRALLARAAGALAPRVAPGAGIARPALRTGLTLLGLALLTAALARPQRGERVEGAKRYGVDLVFALDASRSMRARDVAPDRFGLARLEVEGLVDRLAGNRFGVVTFARQAFVQCPLTTDVAAVKLFLRAASPEAMPDQGTSLESALSAAGEVLAAAERGARAKVVVLLSDGEDHEPGAVEAAQALAASGVRIFAVGVGEAAGQPIPLRGQGGGVAGYQKDAGGAVVLTRLEEGTLREVAERGGGNYLRASGAGMALPAIAAAVERMEKSELESKVAVSWEEQGGWFAAAAFLCLLAGLLLPDPRPGRVAP
ncbi:MAG TPA: VWA domain-containing protein [Anaeromyxobacteraceae bacterium]|jgi:Ca-activated chloride channel family protein|nr:VWA domain-containing protein [Anaeromyxobacteraceae bacterium]